MDCSLPGSSVHGILQAKILEWVAVSFSRGSSWPRDRTCVSFIGRKILYHLSHLGELVQRFPKCASWTSSIGIIWELVRNATSWTPLPGLLSQKLGEHQGICIFLKIYIYIWLHRVLVAAHGIFCCSTWGFSLVLTSRLSCPEAQGILVPSQGSNQHPLRCKADF